MIDIRIVIERDDVIAYLKKRNLFLKYKKSKDLLLGGNFDLVALKKRKPKSAGIWSFRVDKQFRALSYIDGNTMVVFDIDNHQN